MADLGSSNIYGDLDLKNNNIKQVSKVNEITSAELSNLSGSTSNIQTQLDAKQATLSGDVSGHYHTTDRNRANHTGTQLASTISDFATTVRSTVLTGLSTATNAVISATDTVLSALGKLQKQISDNLTTLSNHTGSTSNPHSVTKAQVGLGSVDNTSDVNKPISTATQTALNLKAPLTSPALTGIPTAPTAATTTNTTQIATTAFVAAAVAALVDSSPSALDTLKELADALGNDPNFATTVTNLIGSKVAKEGDTMTGNLTLPASTMLMSPLNIPHGSTPTTPINGDIWGTSSSLMMRINGTTRTIYHSGNASTAALTTATQVEAEAGTSTTVRAWTPQRVGQAIAELSRPTVGTTSPTSPSIGTLWIDTN